MVRIHASALVDNDVELGEDVIIGPHCVVNKGVTIGDRTKLDANVVIEKNVIVGRDNHFFPNSVMGCVPQVLGLDSNSKIGQLVIGDRNVFHENVTIHPSRYEDSQTRIGDENFLMVGAHVGHDCVLEDKIVLSNSVHIGGHAKIETGAWMSGMSGMHQFVTLGKWSFVAGLTGVTQDAPPFLIISGHNPPRIRGVNKRGLQRAGFSEEQQKCIFEAYRRLYRQEGTLLENARAALAEEDWVDENVRDLIESILNSSKHRFNRYLETLRR
jgi:UDP-N-acetylglucosamine acyltransferase